MFHKLVVEKICSSVVCKVAVHRIFENSLESCIATALTSDFHLLIDFLIYWKNERMSFSNGIFLESLELQWSVLVSEIMSIASIFWVIWGNVVSAYETPEFRELRKNGNSRYVSKEYKRRDVVVFSLKVRTKNYIESSSVCNSLVLIYTK